MSRRPLRGFVRVVTLVLLAALVVQHHAVAEAATGWPPNMRTQLVAPAVVYLPRERKAYVFGGRILTPLTHYTDVAVIDLAKNITGADADSSAVSTAPFSLPTADSSLVPLAVTRDKALSDVYDVWLLGGMASGGAPLRAYAVNDLLRAKEVTSVGLATSDASGQSLGGLIVGYPGRSGATTPFAPGASNQLGTDPAVYAFGNWSTVNNTLWRFDKSAAVRAVAAGTTLPPSRGFSCMVRYDSLRVVLTGGNNGNNTRLKDLWTYNLVANTWSQYSSSLLVARDDCQMAVYQLPDKSASYLLIMGYTSNPALEYVNLDSGDAPRAAVLSTADTQGPESVSAHAMFVHDSHLFLVGGVPTALLNIIKIAPQNDGTLAFAWVKTYVPSAAAGTNTTAAGNGTTTDRTATDGTGLSAGAVVGISVGTVAGMGLLGFAAFFMWRRKQQSADQYHGSRRDFDSVVGGASGPSAARSDGSADRRDHLLATARWVAEPKDAGAGLVSGMSSDTYVNYYAGPGSSASDLAPVVHHAPRDSTPPADTAAPSDLYLPPQHPWGPPPIPPMLASTSPPPPETPTGPNTRWSSGGPPDAVPQPPPMVVYRALPTMGYELPAGTLPNGMPGVVRLSNGRPGPPPGLPPQPAAYYVAQPQYVQVPYGAQVQYAAPMPYGQVVQFAPTPVQATATPYGSGQREQSQMLPPSQQEQQQRQQQQAQQEQPPPSQS
ncbi:hypothetical protein GGF31_001957 [Allomyces arbusculus]|nr:hypothetical protein GGF31_001957 [Allomyces arbusculus]